MDFLIRDIRENDKQEIMEMMEDFYDRSGACLGGMNKENCEATFAHCLSCNTYARFLVMECGKEIQGFCLLSFTWSNEVGGMVVLVEELYFKKSARQKGYGKKVFQWIEIEYPHTKRYRLEVTYSNTGAIALYEKLGYKELHYYQMIRDM